MTKLINGALTLMLVTLLLLAMQTFPPISTVHGDGGDVDGSYSLRGMQCEYSPYYTHDVCFPPSDDTSTWTNCNEDEITYLWLCYPVDDLFTNDESYNWFIEQLYKFDGGHRS